MKLKPCIGFAFAVFTWVMLFSAEWIAVVGMVVVLHELAHAAACRFFDIKINSVGVMPWGINITASVMYRPFIQFAVSAAGPLANFFLLSLCPFLEVFLSPRTVELFALANLADGFLNLIPALPLDGGVMLKAVLCSRYGLIRGFSHMIKITAVLGALIMILGIHILQITGTNFSYLVAGLFIIFNIRREKQQILCIRKKLLTGEILSSPAIKIRSFRHSCHALKLVDVISFSYTTVFRVVDGRETIGYVNQRRLMDCVMKNTMVTLGDCVEKHTNLPFL